MNNNHNADEIVKNIDECKRFAGEREAFLNAAAEHIRNNPDDWVLLDGHEDEQRWAFWGWQARSAQPAPVVPEGYVLVPVEPTPDMLDAFQNYDGPNEIRGSLPVNEEDEPTRYIITEQQLQRIRALEFAAPQPAPAQDVAGLVEGARKIYDDLNKRIEHAVSNGLPVPVFGGIAALHEALGVHDKQSGDM
jgi:hypothetical protein